MYRTIRLTAILLTLVAAACGSQASGESDARSSSKNGDEAAKPQRMEPADAYRVPGDTRTFEVTYVGHVTDVPEDTKKLRVWLPVPRDSEVQKITDLKVTGADGIRMTEEPLHGNRMAYVEIPSPGTSVDLTMTFTCEREEDRVDLGKLATDGTETGPRPTSFLEPSRLVVVNDRIRKLADEQTAGREGTLEKARALYDYVLEHMSYDKSGVGWGNGDTIYACDVGKGNCTDFHSLFLSLCRAEGIASGFEIGLYLPYERGLNADVGGYHCWAFFRIPGKTWVPVDISEADKNPAKADYFFGGHTSNRVTLSVGRDLVLEPAQAGDPLNYFLNPYAEADGKPVKTSKDWSYRDR